MEVNHGAGESLRIKSPDSDYAGYAPDYALLILALSLVEGGHKGVPGGGAFSCWSQALPPVA